MVVQGQKPKDLGVELGARTVHDSKLLTGLLKMKVVHRSNCSKVMCFSAMVKKLDFILDVQYENSEVINFLPQNYLSKNLVPMSQTHIFQFSLFSGNKESLIVAKHFKPPMWTI